MNNYQRLRVYRRMLEFCKDREYIRASLNIVLASAVEDLKIPGTLSFIENYPELWSRKPAVNEFGHHWFHCNSEGNQKRIKILTEVVKECKSRTIFGRVISYVKKVTKIN